MLCAPLMIGILDMLPRNFSPGVITPFAAWILPAPVLASRERGSWRQLMQDHGYSSCHPWVLRLVVTRLSCRGALVLTRGSVESGAADQDGGPRLWSTHSGRVFSASDARVEMCSVGMLFNEQNLWANVQTKFEPWQISWNISDDKCWRPFFSAAFPQRQVASVQMSLTYRKHPQLQAMYSDVQSSLEREVKSIIEGYRQKKGIEVSNGVGEKQNSPVDIRIGPVSTVFSCVSSVLTFWFLVLAYS